ncbi:hypothetical protein, partial [Bacillus sp. JJ1562]|uniref:hypothetical protein n=1 Tax=Bacillus sp. JJ1562 TaxID=3122960 RepID=UPI0030036702
IFASRPADLLLHFNICVAAGRFASQTKDFRLGSRHISIRTCFSCDKHKIIVLYSIGLDYGEKAKYYKTAFL